MQELRYVPWISAAIVLGLACGQSPATAAASSKTNFVLFLADDLGWTDLGCYGSTFYESPHIDRLAADGVRFTQAYAAGSVCSPTRASIQTGKYPVRTGVTDYIPGLNPKGMPLDAPPTRKELDLEEVTIGEALKQRGYQTFYSGKWHLGGKGYGPEDQGYEVVVSDASLGNAAKDPLVGDRLTDSALKFLGQRDASRPFFMFLGYHEPHTPMLEHPDYVQHFKEKAARLTPRDPAVKPERRGQTRLVQDMPAYGCEVAVLDNAVRRVREKLQDLGLADSTVVIFFSDNGGLSTKAEPGPTSNLPLRAGKGWLYEGGIRVPLIVFAPGLTRPATLCHVPVISTDLYSTLLELAGAPTMPQQHLDGQSIVSLLRGGTIPARTLYWHYPHYHGSTWAPGSAMREGDWKLIDFLEERTAELYNLREDPGEQHNLAAAEPQRVKALREDLNAWRTAIKAVMPTANPDARPGGQLPTKKAQRTRSKP